MKTVCKSGWHICLWAKKIGFLCTSGCYNWKNWLVKRSMLARVIHKCDDDALHNCNMDQYRTYKNSDSAVY